MSNIIAFLANNTPIKVYGASRRPVVAVTGLPFETPKTNETRKPICPTCKANTGLGNLYKKDGKSVCAKCRYN